ncbi:MAG: hypothetical protein WD672_14270 [Woeseia sp.]
MESSYVVLSIILISLFVIGMVIFLLWKLLEPKRKGESRSLNELIVKPAAVMVGGVIFIGICMIYPQVLIWTLVVSGIFAVVTYFWMPASQKASVAQAVERADAASQWSIVRLILGVVVVFATVAGMLFVTGIQ